MKVLVIDCGQCGHCVICVRQQVIDQLARIGTAINPKFDVNQFKQECAK